MSNNTHYLVSTLKILETPRSQIVGSRILRVKFRAYLPQRRGPKVVNVVIWSELSNKIPNYFHRNDYILVEGFLTVSRRKDSERKNVTIVASKTYPLLLAQGRPKIGS